MKLCAVWFSCVRDARLLSVSAASVARFYPDAQLCAVVQPEDAGRMAAAGFEAPEESDFSFFTARRRFGAHLGGTKDGVLAVILGLLEASREFPDADWLLKMDSDTLWLRRRMMFPTEELADLCLIGSQSMVRVGGRWPYASGGAYFVSREALLEVWPFSDGDEGAVEEGLDRLDASCGYALSGGSPWHEDQTVTSSILWRSRRRRILVPHGGGGFACHHFEPAVDEAGRPAEGLVAPADFLEFGRPHRVPGTDPAERTGFRRRHMQAWLEHAG